MQGRQSNLFSPEPKNQPMQVNPEPIQTSQNQYKNFYNNAHFAQMQNIVRQNQLKYQVCDF